MKHIWREKNNYKPIYFQSPKQRKTAKAEKAYPIIIAATPSDLAFA